MARQWDGRFRRMQRGEGSTVAVRIHLNSGLSIDIWHRASWTFGIAHRDRCAVLEVQSEGLTAITYDGTIRYR